MKWRVQLPAHGTLDDMVSENAVLGNRHRAQDSIATKRRHHQLDKIFTYNFAFGNRKKNKLFYSEGVAKLSVQLKT